MRASDGPSGADVAEVIARTIGALGRLDVGFLRADPSGLLRQPAGWLGDLSDAQIVLVEDAEAQAIERHAVAPELRVIVVPTAELGGLAPERLAAADALVVVSRSEAAEADLDARLGEIRSSQPALPAFVVGGDPDDEGLAAWARWIEARALHRRS